MHAFAFEGDFDPEDFASNSISRWNGRRARASARSFPGVDRVGWFGFDEAMHKIIAYQRPFLVELQEKLA